MFGTTVTWNQALGLNSRFYTEFTNRLKHAHETGELKSTIIAEMYAGCCTVLKLTVMRVTGMARLLRIGAGSSGNVGRNGSTRKTGLVLHENQMMLRSR